MCNHYNDSLVVLMNLICSRQRRKLLRHHLLLGSSPMWNTSHSQQQSIVYKYTLVLHEPQWHVQCLVESTAIVTRNLIPLLKAVKVPTSPCRQPALPLSSIMFPAHHRTHRTFVDLPSYNHVPCCTDQGNAEEHDNSPIECRRIYGCLGGPVIWCHISTNLQSAI